MVLESETVDSYSEAEMFRALRNGDVISVEGNRYEVNAAEVYRDDPFIGQVDILPIEFADDQPLDPEDYLNLRCEESPHGDGVEFRVKPNVGEWTYECREVGAFAFSHRPETDLSPIPAPGDRYYDRSLTTPVVIGQKRGQLVDIDYEDRRVGSVVIPEFVLFDQIQKGTLVREN